MTIVCIDCARGAGCQCAAKARRSRYSQRLFWEFEVDGRSILSRNHLGGLDKKKQKGHTRGIPMLKPLGNRILVKLLSRYETEENKLKLTLVDSQRHYEGTRRAEVMAISDDVKSVRVGDVVVFRGDLGESFSMDDSGISDGTSWRRLRMSDVLAVEEPAYESENLGLKTLEPERYQEAVS